MADDQNGFWSSVKDSFKPTAERADLNIKKNKATNGDQYQKDMQLSAMDRRRKVMDGFLKR